MRTTANCPSFYEMKMPGLQKLILSKSGEQTEGEEAKLVE